MTLGQCWKSACCISKWGCGWGASCFLLFLRWRSNSFPWRLGRECPRPAWIPESYKKSTLTYDQPINRKQNSLEFWGDVGVGNPKKNLQVFTHSHLISYLSCADNRIHLYTMIRKHLKSKHVFWYYVPKLCSPFHLGEVCKRQICKKSPKSTTPALRPVRPKRWVVWNPHTSRRRRTKGWTNSERLDPPMGNLVNEPVWLAGDGVFFLVLKIWRNRKLMVFFCSDT